MTSLLTMTPDELVSAAKAGNRRAFDELVRRFRPRIFALALHLTGRKSDADDVTQEAFMRAYANIGTFEGRSQFFTWLYRIALHGALNQRRNGGRRRTVNFDDPRIEAALEVDAGGDPRRAAELQETYGQLIAAFDGLSPILRTTVVLVSLQGLSHGEAAVVLESTEGTVAWRVHEARKQMRETLARLQREPTPKAIKLAAVDVGHAHQAHGFEGALAMLIPLLGEGSGRRR